MFLLAGLAKLPRRSEFEKVVASYDLLPRTFVGPVSRGLPVLELAVGSFLLVGLATPFVAAAAACTLLLFSIAVGINLVRGSDFDCGCFAVGAPRRITWWLIARNGILIGMAVLVAVAVRPAIALDGFIVSGGNDAVSRAAALGLLFSGTAVVLGVNLLIEAARLRSLWAQTSTTNQQSHIGASS